MLYLHPRCIKTGVIARDWLVESGISQAAYYYAEQALHAAVGMLLYQSKEGVAGVGAGFDGSGM